ncbi:hypothetical protein O7632_06835 [Solwaraspora sp. WMMD406]|uniref:hypothetical protein n=1 Tax=Solwaraspora sp. WMMD406 TaxID=3016095 RepID=UPI0024164682|nr:hypothetical protein [Solwaraspora sp. WMMD406]MDG4763825.1 hypothetical protein [Solwaraspora sp. WMMD406]
MGTPPGDHLQRPAGQRREWFSQFAGDRRPAVPGAELFVDGGQFGRPDPAAVEGAQRDPLGPRRQVGDVGQPSVRPEQ